MKIGRTLTDLAAEIERQNDNKRDYKSDTRQLSLNSETASTMTVNGFGDFAVQPRTHRQIGTRLGIPAKYYDRLLSDHPDMLANNVNSLFHREPEVRMIRTLDGNARAFLSDKYLPLDNYDLAHATLPTLSEKNLQLRSCEITDTRMYIKATLPSLQAEVRVGDVVAAGIWVSNSEIGAGSCEIAPFIERLTCLNGMKAPVGGLRRHHVGANGSGNGEPAHEFYRDDTRKALDEAFWRQVRDTIDHVLTKEVFERVVDTMREGTEKKIDGDPVKTVEEVQKKYQYTDEERGGILRHLIEGGDLSAYGLSQAITREAQDVESYDRASQLERDGFRVLELPKTEWAVLAN